MDRLAPSSEDPLIFPGDYVDRGPDMCGTIDRCLTLQARYTCTLLRGNHEAYKIGYLDGKAPLEWFANGGMAAIRSYRLG